MQYAVPLNAAPNQLPFLSIWVRVIPRIEEAQKGM